tara:strand:+ start:768 stop:2195 length:1428 start_codon:yes stop_codon:yes gene_type:complete
VVSEANKKDITFADCAFSPEREELADHLTEYLKLQKNGYVLNVDGEWGSGKTFFLKAWQAKLRNNHPTCYIDAWTLDYLNEPLATLSRKILDSIHEYLEKYSLINPNTEKKILNSLYRLISTSAKIGGSVVENTVSPIVGKAISIGAVELDDFLLNSGKDQFELFKKTEDALIEFKGTLQNHINDIFDKEPKSSPFFIFIDELDRCRPNYAIEILEAVKHLFCLENTIFVISTNRIEMEKSIQKVYGSNFSSQGYLSRFFDKNIHLKTQSPLRFLKENKKLKQITTNSLDQCYLRDNLEELELLSNIFENYELKPREIEKSLDNLLLATIKLKDKIYSIFTLTELFCIKEKMFIDFSTIRPKSAITLETYKSLTLYNKKIISPFGMKKYKDEKVALAEIMEYEHDFQVALSMIKNNTRYSDCANTFFNKRQRSGKLDTFAESIHRKISNLSHQNTEEIADLFELFDIVDFSSRFH